MNKIILTISGILLLSGCVYEQQPAPINDVSIVEDSAPQVQQPTSMSYPLPSNPQINNVIVNEPQPLPNPIQNPSPEVTGQSEEIVIESTPINQQTESSALPTQQATVDNSNRESLDDVVDSIIDTSNTAPSANSKPMGTFNNPVRFDQSKVYK